MYTFQRFALDKQFYELRCKDRLNCKGRAKYNIDDKTIIVSQKCSIDYEQHNYAQEEIIYNKIKSNNVTSEEMKEFKYQKFFFINTFINYPTLNYNEIAINLVNPFDLDKWRNT